LNECWECVETTWTKVEIGWNFFSNYYPLFFWCLNHHIPLKTYLSKDHNWFKMTGQGKDGSRDLEPHNGGTTTSYRAKRSFTVATSFDCGASFDHTTSTRPAPEPRFQISSIWQYATSVHDRDHHKYLGKSFNGESEHMDTCRPKRKN